MNNHIETSLADLLAQLPAECLADILAKLPTDCLAELVVTTLASAREYQERQATLTSKQQESQRDRLREYERQYGQNRRLEQREKKEAAPAGHPETVSEGLIA